MGHPSARECKTDNTKHWLRHVALVTAYGTMFALVVVFLYWFQVEDASFHWTSLLGYYATLVLLGATLWIARDRLEKRDQIHKHSDLADWLFIGLLIDQPDRNPAASFPTAQPAHADLRHVPGSPDGGRANAGR